MSDAAVRYNTGKPQLSYILSYGKGFINDVSLGATTLVEKNLITSQSVAARFWFTDTLHDFLIDYSEDQSPEGRVALSISLASKMLIGIEAMYTLWGDVKRLDSIYQYSIIVDLAHVFANGAKKYTRDNWKKGLSYMGVVDSAMRHYKDYVRGDTYDKESGLHTMAHCLWNIFALCYFIYTQNTSSTSPYGRFDDLPGTAIVVPESL